MILCICGANIESRYVDSCLWFKLKRDRTLDYAYRRDNGSVRVEHVPEHAWTLLNFSNSNLGSLVQSIRNSPDSKDGLAAIINTIGEYHSITMSDLKSLTIFEDGRIASTLYKGLGRYDELAREDWKSLEFLFGDWDSGRDNVQKIHNIWAEQKREATTAPQTTRYRIDLVPGDPRRTYHTVEIEADVLEWSSMGADRDLFLELKRAQRKSDGTPMGLVTVAVFDVGMVNAIYRLDAKHREELGPLKVDA